MRTLKKTLCLVLCLVMMAGLCVIGANAAYTDENEIQYKEAVGVLSMIKVIEGYPTGDYKPTATLNRAEAAAIMTRLLAVKEEGPKTSSFTDMAGYDWAQPYVAYCEAAGIIAGVGGGKFAPAAKLTTAQFAKMLLCALGFDADREGLVGPSWEINTVKLVNTIDLADALEVITWAEDEYITREQAAQMAFNTLVTPMVEYDANGVYFLKDGTPTNPRNQITNNAYSFVSNGSVAVWNNRLMDFCEYNFPTLKVKADEDEFGLPCRFWFFGKDAQDYKYTDAKLGYKAIDYSAVLRVYAEDAAEITGKQLFKDTASDGNSASLDLYVNGEYQGTVAAKKTDKDYILFDLGLAGATTYLLDAEYNDGIGDTLIVKAPFLAKVTGVTEGEDRSISIEAYVDGGKRTAASFETEDFERGDYILVYVKGFKSTFKADDVIEAELAETAGGTLTKINLVEGYASSAVTLDGVRYPAGSPMLAQLGPVVGSPVYCDKELYVLRTGYTAFLSNGYVIGIVGDAVVFSDCVYLVKGDVPATPKALSTMATDALLDYTSDAGYLGAFVNFDAELKEGIIPLAKGPIKENTKEATWYKSAALKTLDGKYLPGKVAITTLKPTVPALGDPSGYVVTNDATIFILRTKTDKFERYEGIKNVPTYTKLDTKTLPDGSAVYADAIVNNGFAVAVYIDLRGINPDTPAAAAEAPIYVISKALTKEVDGAFDVFTYNVIKDGKKATLKSLVDGIEPGLYTPYYDKDGRITKVEKFDAMAFTGDVDFMENTVKLGGVKEDGTPYSMAYAVLPDAKCFIITGDLIADPDVKVTEGTPTTLTYNKGTVYMLFDKAGKVSELYFIPDTTT